MRLRVEIAEGIKTKYQIGGVLITVYAAYKLIPLIWDYTIAYWQLLIFFLIGIFLFSKSSETFTRALNGLIFHMNRISEERALGSVPLVGWLAKKWDEKETREAAKRRPDFDAG